uniref:Enhancer of rudimentary homolog n=1 Tax=Anopheles culicifacies TaxID=139723 RepID=A0A182MJE4_9DIPT
MSHTILLLQPDQDAKSRTYCDFESINDCLEGVCSIYEEHLKKCNPGKRTITYDDEQLFEYMDQFTDFACLVYQPDLGTYMPRTKKWIKQEVFNMLVNVAKRQKRR